MQMENLEFLKNINTEQNKLDVLIDQNRQKEEGRFSRGFLF